MDAETREVLLGILDLLRDQQNALEDLAISAEAAHEALKDSTVAQLRTGYNVALGRAKMSKRRSANAQTLRSIDALIAKLKA